MSAHSASDLDSTQTVRAVSLDELYDSHRPKAYVIQLVVSDRPVNLDLMPRLEVFAAHRLYAVVGKRDTITQYALRLGFFPDEHSAEMICGHLRTFFASPEIVRVSAAEQARFAQPPAARAAPPKPVSSPATAPPPIPRQTLAQQPVAAKKAPNKKTRTLAEELLAEAREVQLSRSGKHRVPEQSQSWLGRLFGGSKR